MDSYRSTVLERPTLTFSLEGLQAREELLFKAFVRLLDPQTHQQWSYQPQGASQRTDLLVLADGVQPAYPQTASQPGQPVLRLGAGGGNGHGYLSWPLRPDALETELNRQGGQLIRQRGAVHQQVLFSGVADSTVNPAVTSLQSVRLQQWPPTKLLTGVGRMRLATLLTSKAMTVDELAHRSALSKDLCQAFVDDLLRAKLLVAPAVNLQPMPQPATQAPKAVQPGLLSRIRMRLGIRLPGSA